MGATHTDPKAWQRLYIVAVKPDGWLWGALETWPTFAKIRVTDATLEMLEPYMETDDIPNPDPVDAVLRPTIQRGLRKWKCDLDDNRFSNPLMRRIEAGEVIPVTMAMISAYLKRVVP
jgi:hypothetical protein